MVTKERRNGLAVVWLDRCSFNSYDQNCRISITIRQQFGGKKKNKKKHSVSNMRSQILDWLSPKYHVEIENPKFFSTVACQ